MKMINFVLMSVLLVAFSAKGCDMPPEYPEYPEHTEQLVRDNTAFAFDLYAQLKNEPGNLFLSPYSISTALAMTYAGAQEQTAEQMAQALNFSLPQAHLHGAFGYLIKQINRQAEAGDYDLSVANALWLQQDYEFLATYLGLVSAHYEAALERVDFVRQTEPSRQRINDWVARQTEGKIEDLIPEGAVHRLTRLVLTNAIYFKGDWAQQFDPDKTQEADFTVSPDKTVKAPLMHQQDDFRYAQTDTLQILELPYKGKALSMLVLLPDKADGLAALEAKLNAENLSRWQQQMRQREVIVYLPRFEITSQFGLSDTLSAMGMPDAFTENANFSGMDGTRELFISDVLHKAFVEVNEEGTEAAAATGVIVGITSRSLLQPPIFRADRPFIFLIKDNATGSILFLGRLADPTQDGA